MYQLTHMYLIFLFNWNKKNQKYKITFVNKNINYLLMLLIKWIYGMNNKHTQYNKI